LIASVRGRVIVRAVDHVVVDVNGIGYKVFVPRHPARDDVLLHTYQAVREDSQFLYGFETREELGLFEMLISVSGVGPKAAIAILSIARPAEIAAAIATGDTAALARAPGVGKKTAERLIVDLRGKIGRVAAAPFGVPPTFADDAQAALVALGYTAAEAANALREAPPPGGATTEERISAALRFGGRTAVAEG
jgi:Holliday junction DNA helicase RuvA